MKLFTANSNIVINNNNSYSIEDYTWNIDNNLLTITHKYILERGNPYRIVYNVALSEILNENGIPYSSLSEIVGLLDNTLLKSNQINWTTTNW